MDDTPHLLRIDEVAAICRVHVKTVRHWIALGRLQSTRPAKLHLVKHEDVLAFLEAGERPRSEASR